MFDRLISTIVCNLQYCWALCVGTDEPADADKGNSSAAAATKDGHTTGAKANVAAAENADPNADKSA